MNTGKVMTMLRSRGLEGIAEPCLQFHALPILEDEPTFGSSKLGGHPELPIEDSWPTWHGKPLDFLLQLDCREIPPHLKAGLLPATGWIYFFYDTEGNTWGFDPGDRGSWRVLYFDGDRETLVPRRRPGSTKAKFKPCRLTFFESIYLNWRSIIDDRKLTSDLDRLYRQENLLGAMAKISGHQILGNTDDPPRSYEEMQEECQFVSHGLYMGGSGGPALDVAKAKQLESGIEDWRLLLALHSEDKAALMWTDLGTLYFWIREEDLRKLDFDNVWALFQCF